MSNFWKPGGLRAFIVIMVLLGIWGLLLLLAIYADQGYFYE